MNLIELLIGSVTISTILIWLGKQIINRVFDAGIERYKSELEKDLEGHKAALVKINQEHQVRFSKLHLEQANKIKSLYAEIRSLENLLIDATSIFRGAEFMTETNRDNLCREKLHKLIESVDREKIYFSPDLIAKFEGVFSEAWGIINSMSKVRWSAVQVEKLLSQNKPVPESYLTHSDLWNIAYERTQNEFRTVKENLANEFRRILGIS